MKYGEMNLTELQHPLVTKNNAIQFTVWLQKFAALYFVMYERQ